MWLGGDECGGLGELSRRRRSEVKGMGWEVGEGVEW